MLENNYITIQGWMRTKLNLKGVDLMVFAIIYGFSQDGQSVFSGTASYLAEWTGESRRNIMRVLQKLVKDGLLVKIDKIVNGVKLVDYKANVIGCDKMSQGGYDKMSHHIDNIDNYNNNTLESNNTLELEVCSNMRACVCKPPKVDDVLKYAKEQSEFAGVGGVKISEYLAKRFYDYYTATGWVNKNNTPIVDWKAQLRLWATDVRYREKPEKIDKPIKLW